MEANQEDLIAAITLARPLLNQMMGLLKPHLPALTDEARSAYPRPPQEFVSLAPVLVQGMDARPALASLVRFDGAAVTARMQGAEEINRLLADVDEMRQLLLDGRLVQLAEAWRPSLAAYGVSKELERNDPSLRQVIEPLAGVFRNRRAEAPAAAPVV